jgi:fatty acid desaturase
VALIGSRQLGLAILMHDGAHGCFSTNQKLNMGLSQWLCAYPDLRGDARLPRYHLQHHQRTQREDDPDLVLSAPFPITKASYKRKLWRDITGQTGYEQRKAQLRMALGEASWPLQQRAAHFWSKLGPQVLVNALLFAGLAAAGVWWAYPLLWLLPLLTWFMVITRIRNIAEHAVVGEADDPPAQYAHDADELARARVHRPLFRQLSLEHHLFYYVPCYNLPKLHRILRDGPHGPRMEIAESYAAVLRKATAKSDSEDRPGKLVHGLRRQANENTTTSGF